MLQGLKMALAPPVWKFLCAATRLDPISRRGYAQDDGPFILSCLHRDILPAIMHVKPLRPALLVSNSPDGDILVRTLGRSSYRFVRGSTGDGGQQAFRDLVRQLETGHSVGVAVDGPKGPYGFINDGVLQLARLTGVPILPMLARPRRAWVLDTWDRTVVPQLFTRVELEHGRLMHLPRQLDSAGLDRARDELARFFLGKEQA
jgi:lysophospholipid acyltransferase (LPLAT)-like uncharacterized protein